MQEQEKNQNKIATISSVPQSCATHTKSKQISLLFFTPPLSPSSPCNASNRSHDPDLFLLPPLHLLKPQKIFINNVKEEREREKTWEVFGGEER